MYAIRSVFERHWGIPCVSVLMAFCCQAYANGPADDGASQQGPANTATGLGFVVPQSGNDRQCRDSIGCPPNDKPQTSYLLGIKKFFGAERLFSRLGLFGYGTAVPAGREGGEPSPSASADGGAAGRTNGYTLNLNLHPMPRNASDERYSWSGLTYIARDDLPSRQGLKTRGVKYALYIDDCARLEGLYGRSSGLDRYGLGFAQDNWSVALASGAGDARMSLHVGYAIPLGQSGSSSTCNVASNAGSRSFGPNGWLDQ